MIGPIIILVVLLILSAFFSGAEIALMSLSELRVLHLVEKKKRNARLLQKLKSNPQQLLITVLIGNNLANVSASSFATTVSIGILNEMQFSDATSIGVGITTGLMTLLILVFGEFAPKSYCISHAEDVALRIAPIMQFFEWLFSPFGFLLKSIAKVTTSGVVARPYPLVTEDEVRSIVEIGEEEGSIQLEEKQMIHNVFELDNTEVSSVMTPRVDMFSLEQDTTIKEAISRIDDRVYSRIPVFDESIDKIVGIAHAKDILHAGFTNNKATIGSIVRPAIFVPENMMLNVVLKEFQSEKTHIAMVVDEHGGIEGLVTIEDVLEELVGEIYDETDTPEELVKQLSDNSYRVNGKISIGDLNELFDLDIKEDDPYDTLSGLILHQIGEIPEVGESVRVNGLELQVDKVEEQRIVEVILTIHERLDEDEDNEGE